MKIKHTYTPEQIKAYNKYVQTLDCVSFNKWIDKVVARTTLQKKEYFLVIPVLYYK